MTTLWIANTTNQNHQFLYRRPEKPKVEMELIPMGHQCAIRNLDEPAVAAIIEQHEPYGLVPASEARKTKRFIGLCYSLERPVTLDTMIETAAKNQVQLEERADERREEVANAVTANMNQVQADAGLPDAGRIGTLIEVIDEKRGTIEQGYESVPAGVAPKSKGKLGRKAQQAISRARGQ